ncbi:pyridoxamine 5'-phosphate oxidase family protein [Vallicoccus soli]|uniref:Pyridoxamine 5'-phosphate oxidase n=1 Tax=Vallicoccus soli TaxID=2339232 RepID=A0A3A3ZCV5_9ACTN|nr:pyridoxamine 5'-phosphate oxidase family protein [Vallicoccus soli]RJK92972.1 pyridoxamine 5'-phosphate oxidase [Vallicoccus soli]
MADERSGVEKVADIIKDIKTCMLTTVADDGRLVSRPMAVQQVRFDGDLWFASDGDSPKVHEIQHGAHVNAAFASRDTWLSLAGTAEVVQDRAKAEELWNPALQAWFPDGPGTPGLALIRVHAESAEYWDTPGGAVTNLIALATSKVKGQRPDVGENETVELGPGAPPTP